LAKKKKTRRRQKKETFIIKNTNYKYKHNTFNNIHSFFFYQEKERQQTYGKNSFFSGKQEMTKFQLAETWLYC